MKLECIVTDLDASLLGQDKKISPADLETIRALKKKGIYFFIATGRHPDFVRQFAWQTGFDLPTACCNGALIYDFVSNQPVMAQPIPKETAARCKEYLDSNNRQYIIYTSRIPVFTPQNPRLAFWQQVSAESEPQNRFDIHVLDDNFHIDDHEVIKFLIPGADEEEYARLNETVNGDNSLSMLFSGKGLLDVNVANSSKGLGIEFLSKKYGFSLENTLALGDNFNDTSMMELCGIPVCPENAEDDIKAISKYITTHHSKDPLTNAVKALFPQLL